MSKSIISNEKKCFFCGRTMTLHRHHIFYGSANRRKSEEEGCWVYLCAYHHNMSNEGVHFDHDLDLCLKEYTQRKYEETHSREDFRRTFGRSYL